MPLSRDCATNQIYCFTVHALFSIDVRCLLLFGVSSLYMIYDRDFRWLVSFCEKVILVHTCSKKGARSNKDNKRLSGKSTGLFLLLFTIITRLWRQTKHFQLFMPLSKSVIFFRSLATLIKFSNLAFLVSFYKNSVFTPAEK